jgi:hypothetical protein
MSVVVAEGTGPDVSAERSGTAGLVAAALVAAALVAAAAAGAGLLGAGIVAGLALAGCAAVRPASGVYVYLATLPFLAGIDRDVLLPLVRPNEALLALLVAGAFAGGYVRYVRGDEVGDRWTALDVRLGVFALLSTWWPITWLVLRGDLPDLEQLAALLPICKLIGLFVLVRLAIRTEAQRLRLARVITWPAAVLAVIAVLQTAGFPPVVAVLGTLWAAPEDLDDLTERGTATFASSIATGDYVVLAAALLLALAARGLVGRREQIVLAVPLAAGTLAAGQFSTWASATVVGAALLTQYPELRRLLRRFLPLLAGAALVGLPALWTRLSEFGDGYGVPRSWLGRWDNLVNFYLPGLGDFRWVLGVSPDSVLPAPETWRDVIYLEYGYLQFLWVGGLPLLAAFVWLSIGVLRAARSVAPRADTAGAFASALWAAWWMVLVLSVIDIHLVLRGAGELLFTGLALVGATVARAPGPAAPVTERTGG